MAESDNYSVFITGFGHTATKNDILGVFAPFGQMQTSKIGPGNRFVIITYKDTLSVKKVLQANIKHRGCYIRVRPRVFREKESRIEYGVHDVHYNILTQIKSVHTFHEQVTTLINALQYSLPEMRHKYGQLCFDLERSLSVQFSDCRALPFGSTISGLGFRQSDVDVYVQLPAGTNLKPADCVQLSRPVLLRSNLFTKITAIPRAKTPIVKCVHSATGVSCDFNFKSMLGVCNTNLIKYLLSFDQRLLPMMIIIKFWAKVHNISGCGKISNYALVILTIFYLQQTPQPFFIPVHDLQTIDSNYMVSGWNAGFSQSPHLIPPILNKASIIELLHGFFKFCARFDFALNVVSIYSGRMYAKSDFEQPNDLPEVFLQYRNAVLTQPGLNLKTVMCVQDPFELTHNVTASLKVKHVNLFQKVCEFNADLSQKYLFANQHEFLPILLDSKCTMTPNLLNEYNFFQFKLSIAAMCSNWSTSKKKLSTDMLRELWFAEVKKFFKLVLNKILLMDVAIRKEDDVKHLDEHVLDKITYHCTGTKNVLEARKATGKELEDKILNANAFEQEVAVTDYISNVRIPTMKPILIDFNTICTFKINPTEIEFLLKNNSCLNHIFHNISKFFAIKFSDLFTKYMQLNETENTKDNIQQDPVIIIDLTKDT